ncbi:MAG: NAD(P)H-hydrate dehydratase [Kofleriaceae bacterium]
MLPVVTAAEMRALDRATIEEVGIPGFTLMETAGRAVATVALEMLGTGRRVAVVCGPGNNGGDGFVIARVLRGLGVDAVAYLAVGRVAITGYALHHLEVLERSGGVVAMIDTPAALDTYREAITRADLAIDALFGIGTSRAVEGQLAAVIAVINATPRRLAVDIPSGLDSDTGKTHGVAVDAHRTVTMALLKVALVGAPGFARCGQVTVADIGIPPAMVAASSVRAGLVEPADIARWLPRIAPLDHKGTRGHVLVVGGTPEMRGAGRLAAIAALRAGAGLVTLAGTGEVTAPDSVMTRELHEPGDLTAVLRGKTAIVIGPGLGRHAAADSWIATVLALGLPAVLDADALNASTLESIATAAGPIVITPHPGEAARLLGITTAEIEADRLAAARALAARSHAVVVLKGARTIVCDGTIGDDYCAINPTGGPALGTAGSGDVLAGTIAALLAQQLGAGDAGRVGAYVHGLAGERLAAIHGARGTISTDLPAAIADVIRTA